MRTGKFARETLRRRGVAGATSQPARNLGGISPETPMSDLLWLALLGALFALTLGYARLCERA